MRALLRPGLVVAHVLVLGIAVTFVSLGFWQIRRSAEVRTENARVVAQLSGEPVALADALAAEDLDLLPVVARGRYLANADVSRSPWSRNNVPGYDVLTPFELEDGTLILVDRGWLPLDAAAPAPPTGTVDIAGRLRTPVPARQVLTDPDTGLVTSMRTVDPEVLLPQVRGLLTDGWIEVVDDDALERGALPRPAPPVEPDAGPHLSYAFQWFAFTAIGLVGYPLLLRRRVVASTSHTASGPPSPAAAPLPTEDQPVPSARQ